MPKIRPLLLRLIMLAALLLALYPLAPPGLTVRAADVTVSNSNPPYLCNASGLQDAIADAAGGTVHFNCPPPANLFTFSSPYSINVNVIIDGSNNGNQVRLSGNGTNRIFTVQANTSLTLLNITLERGFDTVAGGTVYGVDGTTTKLILRNATVLSSTAPYGGGVFNQGPIIVENTFFRSNSASINDGALGTNSTLAMTSTTFISNTAANIGGAIVAMGGATISSSTFISNTAAGSGGAIYTGGPVTVTASTFTGNQASEGGAIYAVAPASITSSSFTANRAVSISNGGAIRTEGSLFLLLSTLQQNNASHGGGFYVAGDATIYYSRILQNHSDFEYGAGYVGGYFLVRRSSFEGNSAFTTGGVRTRAGFNIGQASFSNNSSSQAGAGALYSDNNTAGAQPGFIYDTTFSGNTVNSSTQSSGGILLDGNLKPLQLSLDTSTLYNNSAGGTVGGAGSLYATANTTVTLRSSIFGAGVPVNCVILGYRDPLSTGNIDSGTSCVSAAANLTNSDPQLLPLSPFAGTGTGIRTPSHMPRATSPAVNAVDCIVGFDQNNSQRPQPALFGPYCDIGAVELSRNFLPGVLRNGPTGW